MTFTDIQTAEHMKVLEDSFWSRRRPPLHLRDQVREGQRITDRTSHLLRAGKIDSQAEWFLNESAGKLQAAGYSVTVRAISGDPEQVIGNLVREEGIQLLVMGAYGHSKIRHLLVGSTTTAMVRTCQIPLLMFR
jgi:nucleotide-binding universal stress UspA family protein